MSGKANSLCFSHRWPWTPCEHGIFHPETKLKDIGCPLHCCNALRRYAMLTVRSGLGRRHVYDSVFVPQPFGFYLIFLLLLLLC